MPRAACISSSLTLHPKLNWGLRTQPRPVCSPCWPPCLAPCRPPSYLVRLADGQYVDTTDDRLRQLNVPRPRSEPSSLDSLPSGGLPTGTVAPPPPAAGGAGGQLYPPPATGVPPSPPPQQQPPAGSPPRVPPAHRHAPSAPPAQPPPAAAAAAPFVLAPQPVPGFEPGLREIADAAKLTKSATSALQFEDVRTAVKLLTEALGLLTQPR